MFGADFILCTYTQKTSSILLGSSLKIVILKNCSFKRLFESLSKGKYFLTKQIKFLRK